MWETIREYLTFIRKERYGVLFLLLFISILFILPYFFRPAIGDSDPAVYEKMKEGILKFESNPADSSRSVMNPDSYPEHKQNITEWYTLNTARILPAELFYFDSNRMNTNDWLRLGLSERLAQTILHYIGKGGRFRKAEDLQKLYGLHHTDDERISPYVRITKSSEKFVYRSGYYAMSAYDLLAVKKADSFFRSPLRMNGNEGILYKAKTLEPTDINQADYTDWSRLPGIGAKLASRIVHFREKLGGFYRIDQVDETFGLPDSGFQKLNPVCN